ncbi:MAG TPA: hypothetical protein VJK02_02900 [Anaerolineales bacterium]|nr:hypothetical protein [Anaerolineales bacterium]
MQQTLELVLLIVVLITVFCLGYLLRYIGELERDRHLPYRFRNGLEDIAAVDTDTLFMIRDALLVIEARMGDKQRLVGEIRQARYNPEQAASPRRGNGRSSKDKGE